MVVRRRRGLKMEAEVWNHYFEGGTTDHGLDAVYSTWATDHTNLAIKEVTRTQRFWSVMFSHASPINHTLVQVVCDVLRYLL
jgi:hypothetical protein